jgi:catechol 2,3-dioxygenase
MPGVRPSAHRLPDAARVGAVRYQIADLERSLWFYRDLVGLRELERETVGGSPRVRLGAAGASGVLVELVERKGARPVPRTGRLGLYHSALLLPSRESLGAFVRHLDAARFPAAASDHLVSEALYLRDPDGLTLEVYADRPRADWVVRDNQYVAALDPLDWEGLRALAPEVRWTGVPAGAVIGHVHFYVSDLTEAASFYHGGLGLDKVMWSLPGALFLSAGGYHHHVGTNTWLSGAPVATDADARLLEWELLVPDPADVEAAAASLGLAGHRATRDDEAALSADPWGTTVRIACAFSGRAGS